MSEFLKKLKEKENEILELRTKEIESKGRQAMRYKDIPLKSTQKLEEQLSEAMVENKHLNETIEEIKTRAVQTLIEKQNIINQLTKKVESYENVEDSLPYLQLKDQYEILLQKYQTEIKEYELKLKHSKQQARQLVERIEKDSYSYDQKLVKLQYDLEERMNSNIKQVLNTFQANENTLLNDLQNLQSTLQRFESKSNQLEIQNQKLKSQIDFQKKRALSELETYTKNNSEQIAKVYKTFQDLTKSKQKQITELTAANEKLKVDFKKLTLQEVQQRKMFLDSINMGRRLSENSVYKHGQMSKSFASQDEANSRKQEQQKNNLGTNQLKDFEDIYEWPSTHKPTIISQFEASSNNLRQSIQSIQALQVPAYEQLILSNIHQINQKENQQTSKLKLSLQESYATISQLNQKISSLTRELQDNRQVIVELKKQKQLPKSDKQTQYQQELESLKRYLYQLEKQLLSQKWKYTELVEYLRSEVDIRQAEYAEQMAKSKSNKRSRT